jgi:hypothetical protein
VRYEGAAVSCGWLHPRSSLRTSPLCADVKAERADLKKGGPGDFAEPAFDVEQCIGSSSDGALPWALEANNVVVPLTPDTMAPLAIYGPSASFLCAARRFLCSFSWPLVCNRPSRRSSRRATAVRLPTRYQLSALHPVSPSWPALAVFGLPQEQMLS